MQKFLLLFILPCICLNSIPIFAETTNKKGRVTGLEVPRFVSLKNQKTFVRRGPGKSYRIDWILEKPGLPLKVIAEHNHWRYIEDFQGDKGWIYFRLLSGKRTIMTVNGKVQLRKKADQKSKPIALLDLRVIGELIKTTKEYCQAKFKNYKGWVNKDQVWGC